MGRDDVPEQHPVLDTERREHPVHDRRRRLRGARPGELALGCERDPADPRAAVAGGLADEDDLGGRSRLEIGTEPLTEVRRRRVLVVRLADSRPGELVYEAQVFQWTSSSTARRRCVARLVFELHPGSGRGWPMLIPATRVCSSGIRRRFRSFFSSSPKIP